MLNPFVIWKVGQHGKHVRPNLGKLYGTSFIVDDNMLRLLLPCALVTTSARCQGCALALPRVNHLHQIFISFV